MQPKYIQHAEQKVVGLGTRFISVLSADKNNSQAIPKVWGQFMGQIGRIKNRVGHGCLGLVEMLPEKDRGHPEEMFYIAGAEVADVESPPAGMILRVIPAGRYALFTHKGKLDGLGETMAEIYQGWLPTSGVKLREGAHLEVYDQRFMPGKDESELDVLLPVG
jgi:predicted transcriptional regulator YdeE